MTLHLTAPVGDTRHLPTQAVDGHREFHAVALDRAANLRGRALRHQLAAPVPAAPEGSPAAWSSCSGPALTASRIRRASSIAMFGTGGAARLTARAAMKPASTPTRTSITAIAKKPQKYVNS